MSKAPGILIPLERHPSSEEAVGGDEQMPVYCAAVREALVHACLLLHLVERGNLPRLLCYVGHTRWRTPGFESVHETPTSLDDWLFEEAKGKEPAREAQRCDHRVPNRKANGGRLHGKQIKNRSAEMGGIDDDDPMEEINGVTAATKRAHQCVVDELTQEGSLL